MLSLPRFYLRLLVHARPLASVAVSGDRHSPSYSPLGSACKCEVARLGSREPPAG